MAWNENDPWAPRRERWWNTLHAPEIGERATGLGMILAFIAGIVLGTNISLLWQLGIIVVSIVALNTWFFRSLEIGALAYNAIFMAMVIGMLFGDVSYLVQTDGADLFDNGFFHLFVVE